MSVLFTADCHVSHSNIIRLCKRPFADAREMEDTMVHRFNAVVRPEDDLWILGDLAWHEQDTRRFLGRLACQHVHYVRGNHERGTANLRHLFASYQDYAEVKVEGQMICLFHYALRVWNKSHHGAWSLYGHSHGSLPDDPNLLSLDVGVDCWDFTPVSMAQLRARMAAKRFKPVDHHGRPEAPAP